MKLVSKNNIDFDRTITLEMSVAELFDILASVAQSNAVDCIEYIKQRGKVELPPNYNAGETFQDLKNIVQQVTGVDFD